MSATNDQKPLRQEDYYIMAEECRRAQAEVVRLRAKQDGSGYFAALKVREDFGCVLHEEKCVIGV